MPEYSPADLAAWCGGSWLPAPPARVRGVSNDTRRIEPGNLYVALCGERFDGHAFVAAAFAQGAAAALVARGRGLPSGPQTPLLAVEHPARALLEIAAGHRARVSAEILGVSGSAGKSTVKEMTARVLGTRWPVACTKGNWNNDIGMPLSLLAMEEGTRMGVFEVGMNHPGELAPLCRTLAPSWGMITNVGPAHIEFFPSTEAIAREKSELLKALPADGTAVLWLDCAHIEVLRQAAPRRVITVGMRPGADYVGIGRDPATGRLRVLEAATGEACDIRLPVPGEHNAVNALFAVAAGRGHGVSWTAIRDALETYSSPAMRWEVVDAGGIAVINDAHNANPMGLRAAIATLAEQPRPGRKWLVLGGMLELGEREAAEHAAVGEFLARYAWDGLIAVGRLGGLIAEGARAAGLAPNRIFRCEDGEEAARRLCANAQRGDAVLMKASRKVRLEEVVERVRQLRREL